MRDNYNRQHELNELTNALHSHQFTGMSFNDISEMFGWTRKTTERMLNLVQAMYGDSLRREYMNDGSHRKVYRLVLPDIHKIPPTIIKSDDIAALRTCAGMIQNNIKLAKQVNSVANKLTCFNKNSSADVDDIIDTTGTVTMVGPKIHINNDIFNLLQNAILGFNQVQIKFYGKISTICPLGILYGVHNTYLVAAHPKHIDNPKKYILNEIESVKILDRTFDAGGFQMSEYRARSFGVYTENADGFDIEWRVMPSATDSAKQYVFHPSQQMIDNTDGSMTIKFHCCGLREMAWHLFTWGGAIVPIAPVELVNEYKKLLTRALDSLSEPNT